MDDSIRRKRENFETIRNYMLAEDAPIYVRAATQRALHDVFSPFYNHLENEVYEIYGECPQSHQNLQNFAKRVMSSLRNKEGVWFYLITYDVSNVRAIFDHESSNPDIDAGTAVRNVEKAWLDLYRNRSSLPGPEIFGGSYRVAQGVPGLLDQEAIDLLKVGGMIPTFFKFLKTLSDATYAGGFQNPMLHWLFTNYPELSTAADMLAMAIVERRMIVHHHSESQWIMYRTGYARFHKYLQSLPNRLYSEQV